jgi:hypothetical protein
MDSAGFVITEFAQIIRIAPALLMIIRIMSFVTNGTSLPSFLIRCRHAA